MPDVPIPGPGPLLLGLEIGGTKLQLGLGTGDGRLRALARLAIVPGAGASGILDQIASAIDPLLGSIGATRLEVAAIGIGFGGPLDAVRGIVTTSHQVEGWAGFPLADWARKHLGVRQVAVQNDADAAALGEARFGAGVGLTPILYVTVGSGIGGGLVIDGRIYRGAGAGAIEIGHLRIGRQGAGGKAASTLEQVASGWSLGRAGRDLVEEQVRRGERGLLARLVGDDPGRVTAVSVAEAAEGGDRAALGILDRATMAMGDALGNAVTLLAPRRIILGGGVSLIREGLWLAPIRRRVEDRVFPPFRGTYDIVTAALGEEVVVHGALALARDASEVDPRHAPPQSDRL